MKTLFWLVKMSFPKIGKKILVKYVLHLNIFAQKNQTVSVQNLLTSFCWVNGKTLYGDFPCLEVFARSSKFYSYSYKKNKIKFELEVISWLFRRQVVVIACFTHSASVAFLRVRRIKIEYEVKNL